MLTRNDFTQRFGRHALFGMVHMKALPGAPLFQGSLDAVIEAEAGDTLRDRAAFAPGVLIFADHLVKHALPIADVDELQMARDLRERGLADAVIISGRETGAPADTRRLAATRQAIDAPILA